MIVHHSSVTVHFFQSHQQHVYYNLKRSRNKFHSLETNQLYTIQFLQLNTLQRSRDMILDTSLRYSAIIHFDNILYTVPYSAAVLRSDWSEDKNVPHFWVLCLFFCLHDQIQQNTPNLDKKCSDA